uniref:Formamidopyrimidine-DNA glycosylase catalytic domain-containing protein n=1 Tax=viral metagenome TaxID=1070528 RepID=A0A6C0EQD2_9ZZZZ
MPESAEVKLTAEYLASTLENKIITDWCFLSGQYEHNCPQGFEEFHNALPLIVEQVSCKGKLIFFILHNEYTRFYILHSLRMTGRWQEEQDMYCRWYIEIENKKRIWFRNPRCLATLHFTKNEPTFRQTLSKLGPDILTDEFDLATWKQLITKHRNKNITAFLMDQSIISGCGNYIKAEVLYYAKVSPLRKVNSLTENEAAKIFEGLRIIPRTAYNYKGLSIRDYADPNGKKGYQEFHLKIYNQSHAERTKTTDGRTTYWDPNVQK